MDNKSYIGNCHIFPRKTDKPLYFWDYCQGLVITIDGYTILPNECWAARLYRAVNKYHAAAWFVLWKWVRRWCR